MNEADKAFIIEKVNDAKAKMQNAKGTVFEERDKGYYEGMCAMLYYLGYTQEADEDGKCTGLVML